MTITAHKIAIHVARAYEIKFEHLVGNRRIPLYTFPRHMAIYLSHTMTTCSFPQIGRVFGGRDHSTIMSAVKKIRKLIDTDRGVHDDYHKLRNELETLYGVKIAEPEPDYIPTPFGYIRA